MSISCITIDTFRRDSWRLVVVQQDGSTTAIRKGEHGAEEFSLPFKAGDVTLTTADGNSLFPPISLNRAIDLAERILEGDSRAATDSVSQLVLAAALVAFRPPTDPSPAPTNQFDALAVPAPQQGALA